MFELRLSQYPDIAVDEREHSAHRWVDIREFIRENDPASLSLISLLYDTGYAAELVSR